MNKIIPPLLFGDSKQEVADLQKALVKLGFNSIKAEEANQNLFGETTCNALKAFKKKFKIKSFPCVVEQKTAAALNKLLQHGDSKKKIVPTLYFGMESDAVAALQSVLADLGFGANIAPGEKGVFGETTCEAVQIFQKQMHLKIDVCYVDEETANKVNALLQDEPDEPKPNEPKEGDPKPGDGKKGGHKYIVSGTVYNADNSIIDHQGVVAYDIDLLGAGVYKKADSLSELISKGGVQYLGAAVTDENGSYRIEFTEDSFITGESNVGLTPDVIVVATEGTKILGKSLLSKRSDFRDYQLLNWNIRLSDDLDKRGSTEFQIVSSAVLSFLDAQVVKFKPWQLHASNDMVEFVSDELALEYEKVTAFVCSDLLLNDLLKQVPELAEIKNATELFYGLLRQMQVQNWQAISKISVSEIIRSILRSSAQNIIAKFDEEMIKRVSATIHDFATKQTFQQNEKLKNILKIAIPNDGLSEKFHSLYNNYSGTPTEFWTKVKEDNELKEHVEGLKVTNQLSALTLNNSSVMTALAPLVKDNNVSSLLDLSDEKWNAAIGNNVPDGIANGVDGYRSFLQSQLHAAFYNEKVSLMVNKNEIKMADTNVRDKIFQFLTTTKFDLRTNRLFDKTDANGQTFQDKFDQIAGDQKETAKEEFNKIHRVFQFSPSPELLIKILDKGIDSATMVASMPFSTFKDQYKDLADEQTLLSIHQRASHIVSMLEYSILTLNSLTQSSKVPAMGN
jgi:peptidoglycan hydrolase-like protein with peptidoglycan-binding domain